MGLYNLLTLLLTLSVTMINAISITNTINTNNINTNINANTYNVLALSGGGSFGAVEIGILDKINSMENKKYDIYTGISAGGLNVGFLSHFDNLKQGLYEVKNIYSELKNRNVFEIFPNTNVSLLNTEPLRKTITKTISRLGSVKQATLIGSTNLNTAHLDIYEYHKLNNEQQINLLMATSAIPVIFPPIKFNNYLYVDGGEMFNEIITDITSDKFINVTFITPSNGIKPNYDIITFKDIVKRNIDIVTSTFNNQIYKANVNCEKPRGVIYMWYCDSSSLSGYSSLDFNYGDDLIKIGYDNAKYDVYNLC